jgi:hypothetical protein
MEKASSATFVLSTWLWGNKTQSDHQQIKAAEYGRHIEAKLKEHKEFSFSREGRASSTKFKVTTTSSSKKSSCTGLKTP